MRFVAEHPEAWEDHLAAIMSRCPHGEADWQGCPECLDDERGTRTWERDREEGLA